MNRITKNCKISTPDNKLFLFHQPFMDLEKQFLSLGELKEKRGGVPQ